MVSDRKAGKLLQQKGTKKIEIKKNLGNLDNNEKNETIFLLHFCWITDHFLL